MGQNWTFSPLDTVDLITLDIRDRTSQVNYEPLTPKGKLYNLYFKMIDFERTYPFLTQVYVRILKTNFILDGE